MSEANYVAVETSADGSNDRCFASDSPSFTRVKVRTHPSLTIKENIRFLSFYQSANLRIFLPNPFLNLLRILLKGMPKRFLMAKAESFQHLAHRGFTETNAELTTDYLSYYEVCPQRKRRLCLSGIFHCQDVVNLFPHLSCQSRWTTTMLVSIQGIPASKAIAGQPAEKRRPLHFQNLSYQLRWLPIMNCVYSRLHNSMSSLCVSLHASFLSPTLSPTPILIS